MFQRTASGLSGGRTFRIGDSTISVGGSIARSDIAKIKRLLADAERYYQTAGYEENEAFEDFDGDTGDFLSDFTKGAGMVRDVANNPAVASLAAAAGPYGAAALAAANGVPAALEVMQRAGVLPEHAQQVAQMHHPDARVRRQADARAAALKKAAEAGDRKAQGLLRGLRATLIVHLRTQLAECQAALAAANERLAAYGDAGAWGAPARRIETRFADPGIFPDSETISPGDLPAIMKRLHQQAAQQAREWGSTSGPVVLPYPPSLAEALERALSRARLAPEPSFRRRPLRGRA